MLLFLQVFTFLQEEMSQDCRIYHNSRNNYARAKLHSKFFLNIFKLF